jgi:ABC-2 type transport system ATP-binding protein
MDDMLRKAIRDQGEWAVEAHGLVKTFGDNRAVDGVDLHVRAGSIYGVLGPNGAGKTTTIRMLATLLRPDAGSALIFGHDVAKQSHVVRQLIGVTGQYASVDESLSATENLIIFSRLLGLGRAEAKRKAVELLEEFGLTEAAKRPLKNFSGGMRRRLDLAASLIAQPPLIFLDEPTTGLDPRTRDVSADYFHLDFHLHFRRRDFRRRAQLFADHHSRHSRPNRHHDFDRYRRSAARRYG